MKTSVKSWIVNVAAAILFITLVALKSRSNIQSQHLINNHKHRESPSIALNK